MPTALPPQALVQAGTLKLVFWEDLPYYSGRPYAHQV